MLDEAAKVVDIGVTTDEIDRIVHEACVERDCYPSPLNYYQFPRSCCTSVNEVICHGIPDLRPLADGDICNGKQTIKVAESKNSGTCERAVCHLMDGSCLLWFEGSKISTASKCCLDTFYVYQLLWVTTKVYFKAVGL